MNFHYEEIPMNSKDIVFDISISKSTEEVWALWTENKKLENWLTVKANIEQKLNGLYELFWDPQNPNENSTLGCHITAFIPYKTLIFEWKGPVPYAGIMNIYPLPTWVVVSFESSSSNSAIIHFRHSGWQEGQKWEEARQWQKNAWLGALEELKKL